MTRLSLANKNKSERSDLPLRSPVLNPTSALGGVNDFPIERGFNPTPLRVHQQSENKTANKSEQRVNDE